jgi:hypothetical protein
MKLKKNTNHKIPKDKLIKFTSMKNPKLKKIIEKRKINLNEMKELNKKCTGIVNLELSGHAKITKDNDIRFYIDYYNSYFDTKDLIPNVEAREKEDIIWHIHPWNVSLDYVNNAANYFSYEDIKIAVTFPGKKFIVFNMISSQPKVPVMYVFYAEKCVRKNETKKRIKQLFRNMEDKLHSRNYNIDWECIKEELKMYQVSFNYYFRINKKSLIKILK